MSDIDARYEFRVWGRDLLEARKWLERLATPVRTDSSEIYFLSRANDRCSTKIRNELLGKAKQTGNNFETVLLVALCGELTPHSSKRQQAEFASRLLLLDILTE